MIDKSLFELAGAKGIFALLLVSALLQGMLVVGQSFSLALALTNLWYAAPLEGQVELLGIFAACFIGRQVVLGLSDIAMARYARARAAELRERLLAEIFETRGRLVAEQGTAAVSESVLEGIDQVENYLHLVLPKIADVALIPLVTLIACFSQNIVSGVILLVLFPVIILFMVLIGQQAQEKAKSQYGVYQQMSNHFIDTLRGLPTLKALGASRGYGSKIFAVSERFRKATVDTLKVATLSGAVLDLVATLGVAAVAMMLGFGLLDGSVALGPALTVLFLAPEYFRPIRSFASDFHASLDGRNALSSINALIAQAKEATPDLPCAAPWSEMSRLGLSGVSCTHDGERPALDGIDLELSGFEKVAIVGMSGSGKSTLVSLLGGFLSPREGEVLLNGGPVDLSQASWQEQVLYLPQEPYLFHASLRDNICFYTPDASDERVQCAVEVMGLTGLVEELPDGLGTVIGSGGRQLSGGQAQRVAFARAFLDDTRRILLLDEPTAHLDIETELELKERMLPLMEGRLVVLATHRLHWLSDMDRVVVLEDGHIVEQGDPKQLEKGTGPLAALVSHSRGGGLDG